MGNTVETDVIEGGLLVYCASVSEASKLTGLKNRPAALPSNFIRMGNTNPSSMRARSNKSKFLITVETHYYKQIAVDAGDNPDSFVASAWIETDANGKTLSDKATLQMCYGGYTGSIPPSASDPKAKSLWPLCRAL